MSLPSLVLPRKTSSSVQNKPVLANFDFSVHYTYYVSYTVQYLNLEENVKIIIR